MADRVGGCEGMVVVHIDGSATCSEPACPPAPRAELVHRHRWFAACAAVFVDESCPRCAGAEA